MQTDKFKNMDELDISWSMSLEERKKSSMEFNVFYTRICHEKNRMIESIIKEKKNPIKFY